jgi:hypothetical protein
MAGAVKQRKPYRFAGRVRLQALRRVRPTKDFSAFLDLFTRPLVPRTGTGRPPFGQRLI